MRATIEAASPSPGSRRAGSSSVAGSRLRRGRARHARRRRARRPAATHRAPRPGRAAPCRDGRRPKCAAMRLASVPLPEAAGPSMATIIGGCLRLGEARRPDPSMSERNSGKLVAIMPASSTVTGRSAPRPSVRKAMAMRWSRWVATMPPPAHAPAALHDQRIALDLGRHAVGRRARRRSPQAGRSPSP